MAMAAQWGLHFIFHRKMVLQAWSAASVQDSQIPEATAARKGVPASEIETSINRDWPKPVGNQISGFSLLLVR